MIKQSLKSRKWLAKLLILAISAQMMLLGASVTTNAAYGDQYLDNLIVNPEPFNPNVESTLITFDLLLDANIKASVLNSSSETVAFLANEEFTSAGTISYTWYGREGNDPSNPVLPDDTYTVRIHAIDPVTEIYCDDVDQIIEFAIPEKSTYTIDITEPVSIDEDVSIPLEISIDNADPPAASGYDHVMVKLTVDSAAGTFDMMVDPYGGGTAYDLVDDDQYWGPAGGYAIGATHSEIIPIDALFDDPGDYTITLDLVDMDNAEAVIATTTKTYTVDASPPVQSTYTVDLSELVNPYIKYNYNVELDIENEDPAGDYGYDHVMIRVTVDEAAGAFDLMVEPYGGGSDYDLVDEDKYWGPVGGFAIGGTYSETVNIIANFDEVGTYTVTVDLIDLDNYDAVIATTSETFNAEKKSSGGSGGGTGTGTLFPDEGDGDVTLQSSDEVVDPFTDTEDHWAEEFIEELRLRGVISGTDGSFNPDSPITRAETVKIVLGLYEIGLLSDTVTEKPFPDVEVDEWYSPYIETGKSNGIISGYGDGLFRPNQYITRAEALRILLEASGLNVSGGDLPYSDMEPYAWYRAYIAYATLIDLVEGYSDGTFRPYQSITRAEFAKLAVMLVEMQ